MTVGCRPKGNVTASPLDTLVSLVLRETCDVEQSTFDRVRRIALSLPGVSERVSHDEPCFFIRSARALCYYHDNHNGDGRLSLWCPAAHGIQDELVSAEPGRFFRPQTSARGTFSDWLGVFLDTTGDDSVDWDEIAAIVEDAYRLVAPRTLIAELDARPRRPQR